MSVDGEVRRLKNEADEPGWEVDPDDDWGVAVVATVGRQLRLRREAVGMAAARMARHAIFERSPAPTLSFVQEEVTLRRPVGGRMVWRRQLERLLELGQLRNVSIQVMPTDCEEHFGTGGLIEVLKFPEGTAVGRSDGAFSGRPVSDPKQLRILELRYGMIRAQALTLRESRAFIEQMLGEP